MEPEEGELDDEEEEAEHLSGGDVGGRWDVVGEVVEGGPDCCEHCLDALASLKALSSEPDTSHNTSHKHSKVCSVNTKCRSHQHWEVNPVDTSNISIQHSRYADQQMPH